MKAQCKDDCVSEDHGESDEEVRDVPLQITTTSRHHSPLVDELLRQQEAPSEALTVQQHQSNISDMESTDQADEEQAPVDTRPHRRPRRQRQGSKTSTISWLDDLVSVDSGEFKRPEGEDSEHSNDHEQTTPDNNQEGDEGSVKTHRTLSERVAQTVESQLHHHYSALFGDNYSKKEGTFVLIAGIVMAFNLGCVNGSCVSGFLTANGEKQVVAGFAGPFAYSSIALAQRDFPTLGFHSNLILSYMMGAWISGFFTPQARPYSLQPTYGPTFLVGGIMLFMASVLAALKADAAYIFYLTACANGLQNGIASIYSSNLIRCSMTGAITDVALAIGQACRGNTKSMPKAIVLSLLTFFFWVGGIASFYMTRHFLTFTLFFNAALFWLVGAAWVVFLVKNVSISAWDAILGTWQWKKTLRQLGGGILEDNALAAQMKLKAVFDDIDGDGNGEIDHEELLHFLLRTDKRTTVRAVRILMRCADKDNDGTISRQEWEEMIHKLYA